MLNRRNPRRLVGVLTMVVWVSSAMTPEGQSPPQPAGQTAFRLLEATIDDIHAALKSGQTTCRTIVSLYLKRIDAYNKAGVSLNAVQNVNPKAMEEADRLDAAFKSSGPTGPLHCIPVLVKDQIDTSDMPTTYGSAVFEDFVPLQDATVVAKLKGAGAIILGKATMGEFANGYIGSAFGITRNAYDPTRHPSGSSGGSAAGVAANFAAVGIGEDTGGSSRGPAAVQNLVGVRPTVPLVSKRGMMPGSPSRDTIGPITRTVKDAATVLDVIAGYDPLDPVTAYAVGQMPASYTALLDKDGLKGARIGIIRKPMDSRADPNSEDFQKVQAVKDEAFAALNALGAELVDVTLPEREGPGDGSGAGGGEGGGRGGGGETEQAIDKYLSEHPNAPVKTLREILLSGKVLPARARQLMGSVGRTTDQPGYLRGLATREEARIRLLKLMADLRLDALVYATFDYQPAKIPSDVLTRIGNVYGVLGNNRGLSPSVGFPAMTVPAGFTTDGMPVGLEFLGRPFTEGELFKFAYAFEQGTHHRKPPSTTPPLAGEP